ncbi:hypothetical protein ASPZODRAFT_138424 [Penicilliopsis zonata CBS 506.65]|uniref:AB hydrolase-1 domain-containing protein n=1 Tax=Penicilliopsis zonata CBS 506.65 TaxID=1073090 RepID=A0A1L9SVV7_9EURO|nr:hypothetical protein ASPZODRAFT_138424 [Penicilliopsis zonata CBS 506.65]OJJ51319.1 hypothetical protein ASPZODRAFT_138424 [Penicilliopsis zonata CBS 506.65]
MPFIEVNHHRLHYHDSHPTGPPPGGQTLLLIHGLGSSQNYYFPILPYLTSKHRCIALDTYGSGRSAYTGLEFDMTALAADVAAVLSVLGVTAAIVVGHSMGGLAVTYLGSLYADLIKGVVAIGPTHPSDALVSVMTKRAEIVAEDGMESMANSIPEAATGSKATPLQKAFIRELILSQNPKGYATLCRLIASAAPGEYAAIRAPFLLIAGEEDKSASLAGCEYLFERVGSANKKMVVLEGVGHWHCIEANEEVGGFIADFVDNLA